jgi:GT2 family glycosyltransferase
MIRKSIFDKLGGLDEAFNPGYGEDIDFCYKARNAGYRVVQVPNDVNLKELRKHGRTYTSISHLA